MMNRKIITLAISLLAALTSSAQQSNINLSFNPQKDAEGLIPFSANLNSPQVNDDRTVTFRLRAPKAESVALSGAMINMRVKPFREALDKHGIEYEYFCVGETGHDWSTWIGLLYYGFLPNLWKK